MSHLGVKCLKCGDIVWMNPLEEKKCRCKSVSISLDNFTPIIGHKRGVQYEKVKEVDGKIVTFPSDSDWGRTPPADIDDSMANEDRLQKTIEKAIEDLGLEKQYDKYIKDLK